MWRAKLCLLSPSDCRSRCRTRAGASCVSASPRRTPRGRRTQGGTELGDERTAPAAAAATAAAGRRKLVRRGKNQDVLFASTAVHRECNSVNQSNIGAVRHRHVELPAMLRPARGGSVASGSSALAAGGYDDATSARGVAAAVGGGLQDGHKGIPDGVRAAPLIMPERSIREELSR